MLARPRGSRHSRLVMANISAPPPIVVFDVGNVLIHWDPLRLYRDVFAGNEARGRWFLHEVCAPAWNLEQDRGRDWRDAVAGLSAEFPEWRDEICAYHTRWRETLGDPIAESVEALGALTARGTPVYAITNFSGEKFREARALHPFLDSFRGVVVSGDEGLVKPDAAIYLLLLERYDLAAADCLFIDDSAANVAAARGVGMRALHFRGGASLRADLAGLGVTY